MPRGCASAVHVHLKGRHFIVEYDAAGEVLRIKERKQKSEPYLIGVYDASWWTASSHPLGSGDTLPKRIIVAAAELQRKTNAF